MIERALRDTARATLLFAIGLVLVEVVLAGIAPSFATELQSTLLRMPFFRRLLSALLGVTLSGDEGTLLLQSIPWVHPLMLSVLWGHAITHGTRFPAGEIDRATIDVLLGLPVSRWEAWRAEGLVFAGSIVVLVAAVLLGNGVGSALSRRGAMLPAAVLVDVLPNLVALTVAVAGITSLFSAVFERRGRAIAWSFGVVIASFLVNFAVEFWEPAAWVEPLCLLSYYRPLEVARGGGFAWVDVTVLFGVGLTAWVAGGLVFARRDIHTT